MKLPVEIQPAERFPCLILQSHATAVLCQKEERATLSATIKKPNMMKSGDQLKICTTFITRTQSKAYLTKVPEETVV